MSRINSRAKLPEIWRPVVINDGLYEGMYQVSQLGRVRRNPAYFSMQLKLGRGSILKERNPDAWQDRGYRQVQLYADGRSHNVSVHRLVMTAFIGPLPGGRVRYVIDHIDHNPSNNKLSNLRYITNKYNINREHRTLKYKDKMYSWSELVEAHAADGVHIGMVKRRVLRLDWSYKRALTTPPMKPGRPYGS